MIAIPPHNRKLALGGVSLTKAKLNKNNGKALDFVRDEVEKVIIDSHFLEGATFSWITIIIRYGLKNDDKPSYKAINKKYGDLPLAIEIDTNELIEASFDELKVNF